MNVTPPLNAALRIVEGAGVISRDFHRWLSLFQKALRGPLVGDQASGTFAIQDEQFGIHAKRLMLIGSERATIYGSGRLVICG